MDSLIRDHENAISPGSEFRETHVLGPLLYSHAHWDAFQDVLRNGVKFEFSKIYEDQRIYDLNKALDRGNHKSVESQPEVLKTLVQDDVNAGFQLPIPKDIVRLIKNIVVVPCGIVN